MVTTRRPRRRSALRSHRGFTLVEFMVAMAITTAVLGGTVLLASQIQQAYTTQADDVAVEQEVRFALDWVARLLRSAGSNPYNITTSACPAAGTAFQAIRIDPDGDGEDDDIRIQADISPPNGILGGAAIGACTEEGEDITISHDADALTITWLDNNTDMAARVMTDPVIAILEFTYLDSSRNPTTDPDLISYVQVEITGRSAAFNAILGEQQETTLDTEVHIRTR